MPFTGPQEYARNKTPADAEVDSTTKENPGKRKISKSPEVSVEEPHRSKRNVPTEYSPIDYGLNRVIDPLGGQAREAAMTSWLRNLTQSRKCRSMLLDLFALFTSVF